MRIKITVTPEHYHEAVKRVEEYLKAQDGTGKLYGQSCLLAVAAEHAGLDVKYVTPNLIKTNKGEKFVLPALARNLLVEFDSSRPEAQSPIAFPMEKLPFEFEAEEIANNEE